MVITDGLQSRDKFKAAKDAAESLRYDGFHIHTITLRSKRSLLKKVCYITEITDIEQT